MESTRLPGKPLKLIGNKMTIKVAINGFGRIGRNVLRANYENAYDKEIEIVAINDLGDAEINAHLLKYDTAHGSFNKSVETKSKKILIDGKDEIIVLSERNPEKLPWKDLGIDVVLECTGFFASKPASMAHINAGAKKVLMIKNQFFLACQPREEILEFGSYCGLVFMTVS